MGLTVIMNHIYVYRLLCNIKSTERNYSLVQYTNKRIKSIYYFQLKNQPPTNVQKHLQHLNPFLFVVFFSDFEKDIYHTLFQIETPLISFCGFGKLRYLCLLTICNEAECEARKQQKKNIGGRKGGESEKMCGDWI